MIQRNNSDRNSQFYNKLIQLGLGLMALCYVVLGILVIFKKWLLIELDQNAAYLFGTLLVLYGAFRGYRVYLNLKE